MSAVKTRNEVVEQGADTCVVDGNGDDMRMYEVDSLDVQRKIVTISFRYDTLLLLCGAFRALLAVVNIFESVGGMRTIKSIGHNIENLVDVINGWAPLDNHLDLCHHVIDADGKTIKDDYGTDD